VIYQPSKCIFNNKTYEPSRLSLLLTGKAFSQLMRLIKVVYVKCNCWEAVEKGKPMTQTPKKEKLNKIEQAKANKHPITEARAGTLR